MSCEEVSKLQPFLTIPRVPSDYTHSHSDNNTDFIRMEWNITCCKPFFYSADAYKTGKR